MPGVGGSLGCCAVCGENFVCDMILGTSVLPFNVTGCKQTLYTHAGKCETALRNAKTFTELPEKSPLRLAFEEERSEMKDTTT